jgi:hypothetical protein
MAPRSAKPPLPAGISPMPRRKGKQQNSVVRASVQSALSVLRSTEMSMEHFSKWAEEARRENNDRGSAILIATNLETALELALISKLQLGHKDRELFGNNSPLGTFDFKIRIGFILRIFGKETRDNLEVVRWIRNAFAHAKIPIKFSDKALMDACSLLTIPSVLLPPVARPRDWKPDTLETLAAIVGKARYERVCEGIAHNLFMWSLRQINEIPADVLRSVGVSTHNHIVLAIPKPLP